ncbi:MarR family winged helix-turn-helix transcriptional regulator [Aquimarina rhabdastrellae]
MDVIKELGYKALDSRFKRISDKIGHEVRQCYRELNLDIEPNWYLIFKLLQQHKTITMVQIAEYTGYAHPTIVVIIKKMIGRGYIFSIKDPKDQRKQLLQLTDKAVTNLPLFEKVWESCEQSLLDILNQDKIIIQYLDTIDQNLKQQSFKHRLLQHFQQLK